MRYLKHSLNIVVTRPGQSITMNASPANLPRMLPRRVQRETPLVGEDNRPAVIIYPSGSESYRRLAHNLADGIQARTGIRLEMLSDHDLLPTRSTPLPEAYRRRPLIVLGNLNTNRLIMPLYASFLCSTDALYPGGDGYELRTLVNPYGTGTNVILAGGSTLDGVEQAVDRLLHQLDSLDQPRTSSLPFLLEVNLHARLAHKLASWPNAPLGAAIPDLPVDKILAVGNYTSMYAWTGDTRYGTFARDCLLALHNELEDSYGDRHYFLERVLRALPWLAAGGFLTGEDLLRTDQLLLGTALGNQGMWWRMRDDQPPLGHRHHGKGTYEFFLLAQYLRKQAVPNEPARRLCDQWVAECSQFLDGLGRAAIDDQDDETTLNNLATIFWYALSEERYAFFESGNARLVAERALAIHDNKGAGAGQGGYGESHSGAMYLQQEATVAVAACACYYQDGRYKWILERMPNLGEPIRGGFWSFSPIFMHKFDTGPELPSVPPQDLAGVKLLPITAYQFDLNNAPPVHIEHAGHSVNARETWLTPEGVDVNHLPQARGFHKLVLRSHFDQDAAYLLLQGYQGGYRWQGHMQAANCIVRFSQNGHIFLIQNAGRHSHYYKNGVFVSNGFNTTPMPPIAEWLAVDEWDSVGISATHLSNYHDTEWTRHLFWAKAGTGFFVVMDVVEVQEDGPYSLTCTWRTPAYATLQGRTWESIQGDHRFVLRAGRNYATTNEEESEPGAVRPYVLRQTQHGTYPTGSAITFQNLFFVRPQEDAVSLDLRQLTPQQALITDEGKPVAWCAAALDHDQAREAGALRMFEIDMQAVNAWITADGIALTGATALRLPDSVTWRITSDHPVGLYLDLATARLTLRADTPDDNPAAVTFTRGGASTSLIINHETPTSVDLPVEGCVWLMKHLLHVLDRLAAQETEMPDAETAPLPAASREAQSPLGIQWTFAAWTPVSQQLRRLTVTADPPPLDGFPEQLIDTRLPELRESWVQWPDANTYTITVLLPDEAAIKHVDLVGDSLDDPFLYTFCPLPARIKASASSDGFRTDDRPLAVQSEASSRHFIRYRGQLDRFETRRIAVDQTLRQMRITIPRASDRRPLVLHQIEVYGNNQQTPPITHLATADLTGTGSPDVIAINANDELVVLAQDGRERWRTRLDQPVTHLSCHDLQGRGQQSVCIGTAGGEIHVFSPGGEREIFVPLREHFKQCEDAYFGWVWSIHALNVWHRDTDGRASLVAGGYAVNVFLDPNGNIVGHSWADGSWQTDILVDGPDTGGKDDVWVRCGWVHGIFVYDGAPGMDPSRAAVTFGGVKQPMFRALGKVIPFVTGPTLAFEWCGPESKPSAWVLAASDLGIGVLSTATRDWLWKHEGGTQFTACIAPNASANDRAIIISGDAGGFVSAFDRADGKPLRRIDVGAPVVGLVDFPEQDLLVVATKEALLILDRAWRVRLRHTFAARQIQRLGNASAVIVAGVDSALHAITLPKTGDS
jgi:hypothetical protein